MYCSITTKVASTNIVHFSNFVRIAVYFYVKNTMYTVYGIPNCNTVKKALDWLTTHQVPYQFHDYKKKGVTPQQLTAWSHQVGYELLINKKGTTWRQLPAEVQQATQNVETAISLMLNKNSVIKRPIIVHNEQIVVLGFDEVLYQKLFLHSL